MKVLNIEAKIKNLNFFLSEEDVKKLPNKIFIVYSIQYKDIANQIKKHLEKNKIKVTGLKQILGCSKLNIKYPILIIGSGRFHAMNLMLQSNEIYIFENNSLIKIPFKDIEIMRMRLKTSLLKFLSADNIGIIVSTKPGQANLDLAIKIKEKLKSKNKNVFIFLSDNVDVSEFENFDIDSWINTACKGLSYNSPDIINYSDLKERKLL
ncbi:MAG: diphthamide synthesis protein [Candidatus Pacearchaeota archaeon]